jgi:pimeloyl-ACP methyl ester carboxylesterase
VVPLSRLERPALLAGLALVLVHLIDLALRGTATSAIGIVLLLAAAGAWVALQPRLSRVTRAALGTAFGLAITVMTTLGDAIPFFATDPQWDELSGAAATLGGILLVASGVAAAVSPPRTVQRHGWRRAGYAGAWLVGAFVFAELVFIPFAVALYTVHAPRLPISDAKLGIAHENVRVPMADGRKLSAWYVPSRNGAAVVVIHGSSGNRGRTVEHARMLARHGYGVLALDLPGNGQSDGRSNGLGSGAQPAVTAAVRYLARRPDVHDGRIGGLGLSLGAELLLDDAARDSQLRAVVADGAERDSDDSRLGHIPGGIPQVQHWLTLQAARAVSGARAPQPLVDSVARIAPRPVLLIATSTRNEIDVNHVYRDRIGTSASLWTLPHTTHTQGLSAYPRAYEKRVADFLDDALRANPA